MTTMLRVHFEMIKRAIAERLAYRGDYILSLFGMMFSEILAPLFTSLIYDNSKGFPGWTIYEVLILQGTFILSKGISFPLFYGLLWRSIVLTKDGMLELILLKPRPKLWYLISASFDTEDWSKLILGGILVGYAGAHIDYPLAWGSFAVMLIIGLGVFFALALIASGIAIRVVNAWRMYEITDALMMFTQYPRSLFGGWVGTVTTVIVPVALVAYVPAATLLRRPVEGVEWMIIAEIVFLIATYLFWENSIKNYSGAGG